MANGRTVTLHVSCPFCSKVSDLEVQEDNLYDYQNGAGILEAFPRMNQFERELIISGICFNCQEKTFNTPAPGHEAEWGEMITECGCCGAPIWEKDIPEGSPIICPCCGYPGDDADDERPLDTPDFR